MLATPLLGAALALAASPAPYSTAWSSQAALQTLSALRERTSARPLDLLEDLYDAESGLCSEGVWHIRVRVSEGVWRIRVRVRVRVWHVRVRDRDRVRVRVS